MTISTRAVPLKVKVANKYLDIRFHYLKKNVIPVQALVSDPFLKGNNFCICWSDVTLV